MRELRGCKFQYIGSLNPDEVESSMGKRLESNGRYVVYIEGRDEVYEIPGRLLPETLREINSEGGTGKIVGPVE